MSRESLPNGVLRGLADVTAACLLGVLFATGCAVERTLTIKSMPDGATVRVDEELLVDENGEALRTPIKMSFQHYGVRRLALYRDGYRTASKRIRLRAPWYLRFPVDLFTEVLFPVGWTDRRSITFELDAESGRVDDILFESVLERAETLRRAGPSGPRPRDNAPLPVDRLEDPPDTGATEQPLQRDSARGAE